MLERDRSYSDSTQKFPETDIINILEFLIDNIFAMFGGRVFQQTVGIPMGSNLWGRRHTGVLTTNTKKLARFFNFTLHYIDDVL